MNNNDYLDLKLQIRTIQQELYNTNQKLNLLDNFVNEIKILEAKIDSLESKNQNIDCQITEKITKTFAKNTLLTKDFTEKSYITVDHTVLSLCVFDSKCFIIGGDNNFIQSYSIANPVPLIKYTPITSKPYSIMKILKLPLDDLFITLERQMTLEKKKEVNILNVQKKYIFDSKLIIRSFNNSFPLKEINYIDYINGKIYNISLAGNLLFFDFLPNESYNINESNNKYIRLYYKHINREMLNEDNDITLTENEDYFSFETFNDIIDFESRLSNETNNNQSSHFEYKQDNDKYILSTTEKQVPSSIIDKFEVVVIGESSIYHIFNNLSYNSNMLKIVKHEILDLTFGIKELKNSKILMPKSLTLGLESTIYLTYKEKNVIVVCSLLPTFVRKKTILTKYDILSIKRLDYVDDCFCILTFKQLILMVNESQRIYDIETGNLSLILQYNDISSIKLLFTNKGKISYLS